MRETSFTPRGSGLSTHRNDVLVGAALVWLVVFCVLQKDLVHVGAGVLEQLVVAVEDDQGNLTVTQHAQLVSLLHQAKLALGKGHLQLRRLQSSEKHSSR